MRSFSDRSHLNYNQKHMQSADATKNRSLELVGDYYICVYIYIPKGEKGFRVGLDCLIGRLHLNYGNEFRVAVSWRFAFLFNAIPADWPTCPDEPLGH